MDDENIYSISDNESSSTPILNLNAILASNESTSEQPQLKKIKLNKTHGGSELRSWVWLYFMPEYRGEVRYAICQIETMKGKKCMKTYKTGTSTSNCAVHLANAHGITEEQVSITDNSKFIFKY